MSVVLTAFGIIYIIIPVFRQPGYFFAVDCYNTLLNVFLYSQCLKPGKRTGCKTLLNTDKTCKPVLNT